MDHIVQGTAKWDHCASLVQEELDCGIGTLMLDCIRWALIAGPVGRDPHVGPPVLLDHATLTEILRVTICAGVVGAPVFAKSAFARPCAGQPGVAELRNVAQAREADRSDGGCEHKGVLTGMDDVEAIELEVM